LLTFLAALLLVGCTADGVWQKRGVSAEKRRGDQDTCLRYARNQVEAQPEPTVRAESSRRVELYEECLRRMGYRRVP